MTEHRVQRRHGRDLQCVEELQHVFAVGSNELTARLCGVPVERVKLWVYVLGGAFAGVGAVLQFAYLTGGDPTTAAGLELNIIAAVVIGGASLAGGQGTIIGTLVARRRWHTAQA